jgi:ABC-type antimicrobial peptide transport system permease subunit
MGFPFLRGREFDRTDDGRAIVIRGDMARRLWGSSDPIGRRLVPAGDGQSGTAFVVIGVVDETRAGLSGENDQDVFAPTVARTGSLLVRTREPADPLVPTIRAVANAEAPLLPITSVTTLAAADARQRLTFKRASSAALGGGIIALFLSAIGLYAIVSFAVNQRTREIGIRTALGADAREVVRMFFTKGLRLSLIGLAIGSVSALW